MDRVAIPRMTKKDYEARYTEAVQIVKGKIRDVGDPGVTPHGVRFLRVGGMLYDDEMVFSLAWGKETARDIVSKRRIPHR